jgi:predicted RNA-binding protein (virulence factor B family)
MAKIGQLNTLQIIKEVDFGVYLNGDHLGEILLPKKYVPQDARLNQWLEVFIYLDSKDRLVASIDKPIAVVGEVAFLRVTDVNPTGAFLNWGMPKDLLAPYSEQRIPMEEGRAYCVYLYIDNSGRIAASSKISLYLDEYNPTQNGYKKDQQVKLLISSRSDLGYSTVINGTHLGLIHTSELLQNLRTGQKLTGYIQSIREDGKINLSLQQRGKEGKNQLAEKILEYLAKNNGLSKLSDKSTPAEIFQQYRVSKASYKKALSFLYKNRKITIFTNEIKLI